MDIAQLRQLISDAASKPIVTFTRCLDRALEAEAVRAEKALQTARAKGKKTIAASDITIYEEASKKALEAAEAQMLQAVFRITSVEHWARANAEVVKAQLQAATKDADIEPDKWFEISLGVLEKTFQSATFAGEETDLTFDDVKQVMTEADVNRIYFELQKTQQSSGITENPLR